MAQGTKLVINTQRDLDECAKQWKKTRTPMYYTAWFEGVKKLASQVPQVSSSELRPVDIHTLRRGGSRL